MLIGTNKLNSTKYLKVRSSRSEKYLFYYMKQTNKQILNVMHLFLQSCFLSFTQDTSTTELCVLYIYFPGEPNRGDKQWVTYVRLGANEEKAELKERGVMGGPVHVCASVCLGVSLPTLTHD